MKTRSADGLEIDYEVQGAGEPAVVLVHGWAMDRSIWDDAAPHLARRHRVVSLDLAGHGASSRGRRDWTIASLAADAKAAVDAAAVRDVILVGHSMGGAVVLEAARLLGGRARGIVLVDMFLDVEDRMPAEAIEATAAQLAADYGPAIAGMTSEYLVTPATPPAVRQRVLDAVTAMDAATSIALLRATWAYDPRPVLRGIRAPVRAVNADRFPTNLEANRRSMPGYAAEIVAGTGHYLMLEKPAAFRAALDRALAGLTPPAR
jgi:pimeloyl-ACP methyl ester carboxylesterase